MIENKVISAIQYLCMLNYNQLVKKTDISLYISFTDIFLLVTGAQSIIGDTPSTSAAVTGPAVTMTGDVEFEAETDEEEEDDGSYQTEVVNCSCGFNEEDGLMIQVSLVITYYC